MAKHTAAVRGDDDDRESVASENNLIDLASEGSTSLRDINRVIDGLEREVGEFKNKLSRTQTSIRKDIDRLQHSDADIGDRVADIYRQLGQVDARFGELKKASSSLRGRLTRLNNRLEALREQAMTSLADALEHQGGFNFEMQEAQQQLAERAEGLASKTTALTRQLNKSIKENSQALGALEARIVSELERIAEQSEQRDEALDERLEQHRSDTGEQLQQHQARMLMLQQVDQALDRRAGALEALTDSLLEDSEELQQQTETLGIIGERLGADIEALQLRTARLDAETRRHRGFIEQLQQGSRDLGQHLLALGRREDRRFVTLSLIGLLLLIAVIGLFGYGQMQRVEDAVVLDQRAIDTQNQIQDLQSRVLDEQVASQVFDQDIGALKQQLAQVRQQLVTVNDQVTSLDGRIRYIAPFGGFGGDNVIHGSRWLQTLDPERYSIRIADLRSKPEMFDLVQRYNHYLPKKLGYFPNASGGYTLVYGGDFADAGEVEEALRWMPRSMNFQPLQALSNREILQRIRG